jgi:hypothetical protein
VIVIAQGTAANGDIGELDTSEFADSTADRGGR